MNDTQEAFMAQWRRFAFGVAKRTCDRMRVQGGDREMLVGEALFGLWRAAKSFKPGHDAKRWVAACVKHHLQDIARSIWGRPGQGRSSANFIDVDALAPILKDDRVPSPDRRVIERERFEALQRAIHTSNERAVIDGLLAGEQHKDIAARLGVSEGRSSQIALAVRDRMLNSDRKPIGPPVKLFRAAEVVTRKQERGRYVRKLSPKQIERRRKEEEFVEHLRRLLVSGTLSRDEWYVALGHVEGRLQRETAKRIGKSKAMVSVILRRLMPKPDRDHPVEIERERAVPAVASG